MTAIPHRYVIKFSATAELLPVDKEKLLIPKVNLPLKKPQFCPDHTSHVMRSQKDKMILGEKK